MSSKSRAVCDHVERPIVLLLIEGETSDHGGAEAILDVLLSADAMVADRGNDSGGYRAALEDKGITPCITPRKN